MNAQLIPDPLKFDPETGYLSVYDPFITDDEYVALIHNGDRGRRIAAAYNSTLSIPTDALESGTVAELVEAFQEILEIFERYNILSDGCPEMVKAKIVLKKAKGE